MDLAQFANLLGAAFTYPSGMSLELKLVFAVAVSLASAVGLTAAVTTAKALGNASERVFAPVAELEDR